VRPAEPQPEPREPERRRKPAEPQRKPTERERMSTQSEPPQQPKRAEPKQEQERRPAASGPRCRCPRRGRRMQVDAAARPRPEPQQRPESTPPHQPLTTVPGPGQPTVPESVQAETRTPASAPERPALPDTLASPDRSAPPDRPEPPDAPASPDTSEPPPDTSTPPTLRLQQPPRPPRARATLDGSGDARAAQQPGCLAKIRRARGGTRARVRGFRRRGREVCRGGTHPDASDEITTR